MSGAVFDLSSKGGFEFLSEVNKGGQAVVEGYDSEKFQGAWYNLL